MIKLFISLSFLFCEVVVAQNHSPTYFDRFTNEPNIEWAIWHTDTVHFTHTNLSEVLRKKYQANKIKVCAPTSMSEYAPQYIRYASKCELKWGAHCHAGIPITDSLGNIVKKTKEEQKEYDEFIPENSFTDSSAYNVLDIPQMFYVENNKLKVYIPYVITERAIFTSEGILLGPAYYFTAAFNFNRKNTSSPKDKIIFLQQTSKRIKVDLISSGQGNYHVKQLYERNLVETLWPLIMFGKSNVISTETNKKLSMEELYKSLIHADTIEYPLNSNIEPSPSKDIFYHDNLSPGVFKEIQIDQIWYYNETKNIIFCNIPEVILYANRIKNKEYEKELSPILKIVF